MAYNPRRYRAPETIRLSDRTWPERTLERAPTWCSVDLRDGNQALAEPMGMERKQRMLAALLEVGFREIELGFPSASQTDFDFIRWVIEENVLPEGVTPQVITQARPALIERTFESIRGAKRAIFHLYNSTSEVQRRVVFGLSEAEVIALAVRATEQIRALAAQMPETEIIFQYSPESFTGTELAFAKAICDAVAEAWGATPERKMIVNLPSTVENTTPNVFADRIEWMSRNLARRDSIILSVHTHNDRGSGVASAELAQLAGAERVEGTVFGNGERSGNVDIVTLALNLYSHGIEPQLRFDDLPALVKVIEYCTRLPVHPRHPYAGELVFTAFSGSHQDAIHKGMKRVGEGPDDIWEVPYLPIDPMDVGRRYESVIRINSQSGKSGLAHVLERDAGYRVPRPVAIEFGRVAQAVTDGRGEELSSEGVVALFERTYLSVSGPFELRTVAVERRSAGRDCAVTAELRIDGVSRTVTGIGSGPIEAFVSALSTCVGQTLEVADYVEHARGRGADAEAVAFASVRGAADAGEPLYGVGRHKDVVLASLHAIIAACNRLHAASRFAQRGPTVVAVDIAP
ncbi:MAG TPA: 2-isopropylmalate synthase [Polyangiaceae bacterium]|nr:2-isopropylmalate synthase [Polyangiaceae bacterium]